MAEIINMPKLGFDMAEGTLIRWIIQEGEQVARGAVLAEIETDKATVEVEAVQEGVMKRHLVTEGTVVPVNAPIAVLGAVDEEINLSVLLGETTAGNIEIGQKPVETNASSVSEVGEISQPATVQTASDLPGSVRASPIARKMAEDIGLDLKQVKGSGPGGRITKKDIENYQPSLPKTAAPAPVSLQGTKPGMPATQPLPYLPSLLLPAPESVTVPLNKLRALIGKRMVDAKQLIPHFYITHEYDVRVLLDLRKEINSLIPDDQKISVNDFMIKAAALGLRQFPNLNASLQGDQIIQHGNVNIGVAVAVEGGLLTIVCKDADRKPLRQIAMEVRTMANRARSGKVRPDDIEGSTFSVSNLGMFSVESFVAIINPPEAAILAVGSANQVPVVEEGAIATGWRMKATISVDHRVSDGAEAARYLQALQSLIEKPLSLLV
ncbi:MAG: hypothetical protein A2Z16_14770 [Chloroflexi bacterium RBG_16_54_18]|nr:MAG: hypothetical protein A2Z16_14770 [Chloroflexi bacterium RBG_16_54_18]